MRTCSLTFLQNGLAFHQELDEVGKTLADWQREMSTAY